MKVSIIVAIAKNYAIGKDNKLLWHISDDLKLFKETTLNSPIIMGRKSFESIGRPLPKRTNVVITRNPNFEVEGVLTFSSIESALEYFDKQGDSVVYIIGGGEIYKQSMEIADELHISHVDVSVPDADTFFPHFDTNKWTLVEERAFSKSEKNQHGFTYKRYVLNAK